MRQLHTSPTASTRPEGTRQAPNRRALVPRNAHASLAERKVQSDFPIVIRPTATPSCEQELRTTTRSSSRAPRSAPTTGLSSAFVSPRTPHITHERARPCATLSVRESVRKRRVYSLYTERERESLESTPSRARAPLERANERIERVDSPSPSYRRAPHVHAHTHRTHEPLEPVSVAPRVKAE